MDICIKYLLCLGQGSNVDCNVGVSQVKWIKWNNVLTFTGNRPGLTRRVHWRASTEIDIIIMFRSICPGQVELYHIRLYTFTALDWTNKRICLLSVPGSGLLARSHY